MRRRLDQFGELIRLFSGLFNEASSGTLMLMDAMATSRVTKLARETGLTSDQQEVEKGRHTLQGPGSTESTDLLLQPEGRHGLHAGPLPDSFSSRPYKFL